MDALTAFASLLEEGQVAEHHRFAKVAGNAGHTALGSRDVGVNDYSGTAEQVLELAVVDIAVEAVTFPVKRGAISMWPSMPTSVPAVSKSPREPIPLSAATSSATKLAWAR